MPIITHFTVSGTCNIDGVTITLGGNASGTTTTSGGTYTASSTLVTANFPLTVTPSLPGFTFSPASYSHTTPANYTTDNFIANTVADQVGAFVTGI